MPTSNPTKLQYNFEFKLQPVELGKWKTLLLCLRSFHLQTLIMEFLIPSLWKLIPSKSKSFKEALGFDPGTSSPSFVFLSGVSMRNSSATVSSPLVVSLPVSSLPSFTLIGKLLHHSLPASELFKRPPCLWRLQGSVKIIALEIQFYLLTFNHPRGVEMVGI